jgi:hypothetical protein
MKKDTDFDKVASQLRQKYFLMSEYEELINDIVIATKEVMADKEISFIEWLTRKDSPYVVMYGEKMRFATKEKDYTIKEVYDKFLKQYKSNQ